MVLERQILLQKEGRYSVQHVLHYPTVPMKVKTPALIGEVNLGCLSILEQTLILFFIEKINLYTNNYTFTELVKAI